MMSKYRMSYVFAGLTILFWGTAASAFKFTLEHLSYVQVLAWSSLFSTLVLLFICLFSGKMASLKYASWTDYRHSIALGFLNPFAYYLILFKAYELLPAQVAQPLNFIWPLVLVLLSVPLLGEKLNLASMVSLIISFIGVIIISSQGKIGSYELKSPLGVGLALSSSLIWAYYWILNLKKTKIDPIVRLFLNFVFATLFSFSLGLFYPDFWKINTIGVLGAAYVGFFEMGITFVLWLKALELADSKAKLNNVIYLVPFVSLMFIRFFLGEQIFWTTPLGLIIIVASIVFQQIYGGNKKVEHEAKS